MNDNLLSLTNGPDLLVYVKITTLDRSSSDLSVNGISLLLAD